MKKCVAEFPGSGTAPGAAETGIAAAADAGADGLAEAFWAMAAAW